MRRRLGSLSLPEGWREVEGIGHVVLEGGMAYQCGGGKTS